MKKIYLMLFCILFVILACTTTGQAVVENNTETHVTEGSTSTPGTNTAEDENFDPATITKEVFDTTKTDVQKLIETLNKIIKEKDYDTWLTYLSKEYLANINNPVYLSAISESARLKNQKIVLKTPEDYFNHVVVPSRTNDRVDDIEFISKNQVKAFTVTPNGQRLRLYNLEKEGDIWKITD